MDGRNNQSRSQDHQVTRSPGHQVTRSPGHHDIEKWFPDDIVNPCRKMGGGGWY